MLFIEKVVFKNGGKKCLDFIFSGLEEVLTSCLHTLLRDQTPCSSLPKRFLWVSLFLIFENDFEEEKRGLRGMRLKKKVRLFQLLKKKVKVGI